MLLDYSLPSFVVLTDLPSGLSVKSILLLVPTIVLMIVATYNTIFSMFLLTFLLEIDELTLQFDACLVTLVVSYDAIDVVASARNLEKWESECVRVEKRNLILSVGTKSVTNNFSLLVLQPGEIA